MFKSIDKTIEEMRRHPISLSDVLKNPSTLIKCRSSEALSNYALYKKAKGAVRIQVKKAESKTVMSNRLPPLKTLRGASVSPNRIRFIEKPHFGRLSPVRIERSQSPQNLDQGTQTIEDSPRVYEPPKLPKLPKSISSGKRLLVPSNMMFRRPAKPRALGSIYASIYSRYVNDITN
mmetsp:Transcript_6660/g.11758  ORF Transcript_6660/g.11758 Transcript_6660/m.11758 type:complete len:176 (-) Transcript_6660:2789-3316(-)